MGICQPPVTPLPPNLSLAGKTLIITGSTAGLGLETARQSLILGAKTVVLACRNTTKGQATKTQLLADPSVAKHNPDALVLVMRVDMDDYSSVQSFAADVRAQLPRIDILILNAGLGFLPKFEVSPAGHERTLQINYLSNVLLLAELLPHLQASAAKHGEVRVSWVGSQRFMTDATLPSKNPARPDETVLQRLDDSSRYVMMAQYTDSKLLCVMWFYELTRRMKMSERERGKGKVVMNMMCPGMIASDFGSNLSAPLKVVAKVLTAVRARPIEQGGWMLLNAAAVLGEESHGRFVVDKDIVEDPLPFINSPAGKRLTERIWADTAAEMSKLATLPPELAV